MEIPFLKIVNKTAEEIELDIDGIIGWGEDEWPAIKEKLKEIANTGQKRLIVNIYSPGGYVSDGLMIHDALKISKAKIETRVFSMTASAATIVAQSGDVRKMSSNALYLIHHAWNVAIGNVNEMMAAVDDLEKVDERIYEIYVKKGGDPKKIKKLMDENNGNGKWIDAEEALEYGLIDEIIEPTRAAAMIPKEFFNKYNLPEIPKELMSKINLNLEGEAPKDKKGVLRSLLDQFTALFNEETGAEPKNDPPQEPVNQEPVEIPVEVPVVEPAPVNDFEARLSALEAEKAAKDAEIAQLKHDLSEAQTNLAQAVAKSTAITGPTGKEGDTVDDVKLNPEMQDTLKAISRVWNGAPLENPKK